MDNNFNDTVSQDDRTDSHHVDPHVETDPIAEANPEPTEEVVTDDTLPRD